MSQIEKDQNIMSFFKQIRFIISSPQEKSYEVHKS